MTKGGIVEGLSGAHLEGPTWTRLLDLAGDGAMTTDARIGSQPVAVSISPVSGLRCSPLVQ